MKLLRPTSLTDLLMMIGMATTFLLSVAFLATILMHSYALSGLFGNAALIALSLMIVAPDLIKKGLWRYLLPENTFRCWAILVLNVYMFAVYFGYVAFPELGIAVPKWLALFFDISFWAVFAVTFIITLVSAIDKRAALRAEQDKQA